MKNLLKPLRMSFQRRFRTFSSGLVNSIEGRIAAQRRRTPGMCMSQRRTHRAICRNKDTHRPGVERLEARCLLAVSIIEFPLPNPDSNPGAITAGPDGNVWFTENTRIGRITPAGVLTEFPIPAPAIALDITAGPDGNLWFTNGIYNAGNYIGRITPAGVITEFAIPTGSEEITAGPDGALWFTDLSSNLGRITFRMF
jgi:hypothetical protein